MGSGASSTERPAAPLEERLRTILVLRAYNCRPRDWTMQDQFDAVAENGVLTKERLGEALRLSECPRIEALLSQSLLDRQAAYDRSTSSAGSISVAALISFVEAGSRNVLQFPAAMCAGLSSQQHQQTPPPPPERTASKTPAEVNDRRQPGDPEPPSLATPTPTTGVVDTTVVKPEDEAVTGDGAALLSPRVVPLTLKSTLTPEAEADPKISCISQRSRGEAAGSRSRPESCASEGRAKTGKTTGDCEVNRSVEDDPKYSGGDGHCTMLVKHFGTVLGLCGEEAYRRSGSVQPVWRKRETLIQERIVQYTTLDEKGTIQELFETEKSQTEVLHMECKQTGEFAHRESTHYESGEAFNGEVVLEETGAEHYVHLRSVDDEYEHLESTLPPRARQGAAGGAPPEAQTGGGEDGGEGNSNEGSGSGGEDAGGGDEGVQNAAETNARHRPDFPGGNRRNQAAPTSSSPSAENGGRQRKPASGLAKDATGVGSPSGGGAGADEPDPSPFAPSPYHYRSPSCSPRLSPSPARSPYRQEGVGGKESSDRGEGRRWQRPGEPYTAAPPAVGAEDQGVPPAEGGAGRERAGMHRSKSGGNTEGEMSQTFIKNQGEDTPERQSLHPGSTGTPREASPFPRELTACGSDIRGASTQDVGDDLRPDLHSDTVFSQSAEPSAGVPPRWDFPPETFESGFGEGGGGRFEREGSVDSDGDAESTVVFVDNDRRSAGDDDGIDCGDGWRRTDSCSLLLGLDFSFGEENATVALPGNDEDQEEVSAEHNGGQESGGSAEDRAEIARKAKALASVPYHCQSWKPATFQQPEDEGGVGFPGGLEGMDSSPRFSGLDVAV